MLELFSELDHRQRQKRFPNKQIRLHDIFLENTRCICLMEDPHHLVVAALLSRAMRNLYLRMKLASSIAAFL